jgi:two-component system NtrC family response regulator
MYKILLIEDSSGVREAYSLILQTEGYKVIEATTGEEGLKEVKKATPDLVILDVGLPDINGFDVLTKIRKFDKELPVIMVTAYASIKKVIEITKLGISGYLVKPVGGEQLLEMAAKAIAESKEGKSETAEE